ncbi:peroxisomal acyl-coenzyme A oxidase 3 [Leguminivora glycinivorella]|uniref:peroxisomal acyl-coenzyme A oxidase 3 n=1 Tax=Leguminivora glycinivorella TaxID=1035111 RepID=UPI00200CB838|nr:peroxisomal acyl-coenzyme A oxidase 3 [Leguminivora glycinivorella]
MSGAGDGDAELRALFPAPPRGPLAAFREQASFDWRRMKLAYDSIQAIRAKDKIWKFMEEHPLFKHSEATPSLDEQRHLATKRMYVIHNADLVPLEEIAMHPRLFQSFTEAIFMWDSSLAIKLSLTFRMFSNTIRGSGRDHHFPLIEACDEGKIGGCFALTEIAHGSNAKGMRTTATYLPDEQCFELHSPDFEAAKCWVGSLGKCATHAIVYAMLVSKGQSHGLHAFVVPVRDPRTLRPLAGVTLGDLGEKVGLNGVDNGFVMFNKYKLPRSAALDRLGGVDARGDYRSPFRDPAKRFGASLGILSGGRVHITSISTNYLQKAVVIAVRYSAARRQFAAPGAAAETPVLLYQQQQVRLLPYLAATFAMRVFCNWFGEEHVRMSIDNMMGSSDAELAARGVELHALSSAAKPLSGWTARDGIQNCRECCGGHGYLKAAGIGELRNDNDANCTYEGENSMLLQQASNWLLGVWARRHQPAFADTPLGSVHFLARATSLLAETCAADTKEDIVQPATVVRAYEWLTTYMLRLTADKVSRLRSEGRSDYDVRNDSQAYTAVTLAVVYGEHFMLSHLYKTALALPDAACRGVLLRLAALYGAFMLERHMATLYIGGFFSGEQGLLLREGIVWLCAALAAEAVSLADTLAPPDWCLNSVLGYADGEVYKHIQDGILTYPGALERPRWWRDVVHWDTYVPAKL